jgi:glycerol-3-phosphate dehydrogenase
MEQTRNDMTCDVLVIGGGINGAGIARDAAGRGLSVALCEKDDLASHTSSASTKLIHGGLRYLEQYEFRLVRKALIEREVLMRAAPHIIHPLRFIMPHDTGQRPSWMIRAGLFLYDHLARRELLPDSGVVNLRQHVVGAPLKPEFTRGFAYSDGRVDDARLVVLNAMGAAEKGATILTRTVCESAVRQSDCWQAVLRDAGGNTIQVQACCLVNAAGPWAAHFLQAATGQSSEKPVRLVKGSHIVVKRLFDHPHAYIFQHPDGRIVFAIPYEADFTLIGTTDIEYPGDPDRVAITQAETDYLCELSNRYFRSAISADDVLWSYSGVRPLVEDNLSDASHVTRDYRLEWDTAGAPMLSIFGGKITTFRKLAEEAVDRIAAALSNRHGGWTANACLPGGDLFDTHPSNRSVLLFADFIAKLQAQYAWLPAPLVARYAHAYGSRTDTLLAGRKTMNDMGVEIAPWLFAAEVDYLMHHEWATCAADVLWRRSKLGLHLAPETAQKLDAWMAAQRRS